MRYDVKQLAHSFAYNASLLLSKEKELMEDIHSSAEVVRQIGECFFYQMSYSSLNSASGGNKHIMQLASSVMRGNNIPF